jgi:hypothetical protein
MPLSQVEKQSHEFAIVGFREEAVYDRYHILGVCKDSVSREREMTKCGDHLKQIFKIPCSKFSHHRHIV